MSDKERFRPDILKTGDNLLFHTHGFSPISSGIRLLTCSYWNHVGKFISRHDRHLILNNMDKPLPETEYGWIVEALFSGVVVTPLEKYLNNRNYTLRANRIKHELWEDEKAYEGIQLGALKICQEIGKKYDMPAIIYLGIVYIFKGYWKKGAQYIPKIGNPFQGRQKFFCSELVCSSDFGICPNYPFLYKGKTEQLCDTTTPRDISKADTQMHITGSEEL